MKKIRSILLVLDPQLSRTAASNRATALAAALQAELTLALIDPGPRLALRGTLDSVEAQQMEFLVRDQQSAYLRLMASQIRNRHAIAVRVLDERKKLSAGLLTELVSREGFDLVVKDFGNDSALRSLMLSPLDRQLLSQLPVPVWLVSKTSLRPPLRFGVAVDLPSSPDRRRGEANDAAVEMAQTVASACAGLLRVFSPAKRSGGTDCLDDEDLLRRQSHTRREAMSQLLARHDLSAQAGEIVDAQIEGQFTATVAGFRPDVLIMGLVRTDEARRASLERNTDKLIEEFPGDLMAVPVTTSAESKPAKAAGTGAIWAH